MNDERDSGSPAPSDPAGSLDAEELARLITAAQGGDVEARNRIFSLYWQAVRARMSGRISPRLRAKVDTMEIVQSGLREALRDLPNFRPQGPGSFYRWLCQIVEHKLYRKADHWQAQRRDMRRESPIDGRAPGRSDQATSAGDPTPPSPLTQPSLRVARSERAAIVRREIESLAEPYCTVLTLHAQGLGDPEIGLRLERDTDAVRRLRLKAMRLLAGSLRRGFGDTAL